MPEQEADRGTLLGLRAISCSPVLHVPSASGQTWFRIDVGRMVGQPDRPQMVLDFIEMIWKVMR